MRIFVYGWYGHSNLGDESFKVSFQELWPHHKFTFGDSIPDNINQYKALFVGGGSFLDQPLNGFGTVQIPIYFIGIGLHDYIHPDNQPILDQAKLIIPRNKHTHPFPHAIPGCDLVFSRNLPTPPQKRKFVTVFLNQFIEETDVEWKEAGLKNFMYEFTLLCEQIIDQGKEIVFFPFCTDKRHDDRRLAQKIVQLMKDPQYAHVLQFEADTQEASLIQILSQTEYTISLRYHGFIFSTLMGVPCVGLCLHDKMKSFFTEAQIHSWLDYYSFNRLKFYTCLESLPSSKFLISYSEEKRKEWHFLSATVDALLNM